MPIYGVMGPSLTLVASPPHVPGPLHHALHQRLARRNQVRLCPDPLQVFGAEMAVATEDDRREETFVTQERTSIAPLLQDVPTDPDRFVAWFENLRLTGPGQNDHLFPWLAEASTLPQMCWFLGQEAAGEAGFEDLLALTQIKMPQQVKLEMARNYWDEMGRGRATAMHGPMLERLCTALNLHTRTDEIVWESLALGNLMVALAWNRRYAYQSVGALGVIELTAPGRAVHVNQGLRRLGVSAGARQYFAVHSTLDVKHSRSWNREVIRPLVSADPRAGRAIAEGAMMRLQAGARCFEAYRARSCLPDGAHSQPRSTSRFSSS